MNQANPTEAPSICADIGVGVFSQILDCPKTEEQSDLERNMDPLNKLVMKQAGAENGNACNIYPRRVKIAMVHMKLKKVLLNN